jgi:hypothetical protein
LEGRKRIEKRIEGIRGVREIEKVEVGDCLHSF